MVGGFEHSWSTENHVASDAEALGLTVERIVEPRTSAEYEGFAQDLPVACVGADLLLYVKRYGLPPSAEKLWRTCEQSCTTASLHLDLYRGLDREREVGVDPFWLVNHVFTADGGSQDWFAERGVNHQWLAPACVSSECVQVEPLAEELEQDSAQIAFVGSTRSYHAQWSWRGEMLAALRKRYGARFATYGPHDGGALRDLSLNALYQTPGRVVVGDSLALPGHRDYFSDRYWETIGRGGFLIGPRVPGIERFFEDGRHFVGYDPGDLLGLFGQIDGWLEHPVEARAIADAGQKYVAATGTYRHRVQQILETVL